MATLLTPPEISSPRRPVFGTGGSRAGSVAAVIAFHLAVVAVLLQHTPARRTLRSVAPIIVSLIPEEPKPPPNVPPPKVRARHAPAPVESVASPPPVVASAALSESPITPTPAAPAPAPVAEPVDA